MFLFIPLLLAVPTVIWWMKEKQRIEIICERQVLAAQENLVDGMNALIDLNPSVEALVYQKKDLELAIRTAPTPMDKAAFAAQLVVVILKIKTLRAKQQMIIKTKEAGADLQMTKIKREVKLHIVKMHDLLETPPLSRINVTYNRPKIYLQPVFIDHMIPTYKSTPQLPTLQSLHTLIKIKGFSFPRWLEFLTAQDSDWFESCSSTPHKGGILWESLLGKARPF